MTEPPATRTVRVFQVDAFTSRRFAGNPAGVVLDADVLGEAEMQAIARELNNGDTVFALRPAAPDHDIAVRFFTPRTEAAFVGHATLALHAVRASLGLPPARRQRQKNGLVEVDTARDAAGIEVHIHQPPPVLRGPLAGGALNDVLAALGLTPQQLDQRCPPTLAGEGSTRALLALRDADTLASLRPDLARLAALSPQVGAQGYLAFTLAARVHGCLTEARMFCPAIGIPEDPVSGNAHGMLGALLHREGQLRERNAAGDWHFRGAQGQSLGRPGQVLVTVRPGARAGENSGVSIGGNAVVVFATELRVD
jgi:PhzF family phenazine biosynthesis protein